MKTRDVKFYHLGISLFDNMKEDPLQIRVLNNIL
jgi:hypothetical protein